MSQRREPTIGGAAEEAEQQVSAAPIDPPVLTQAPSSGGGGLAVFALLLALAAGAAAGYLYWQGQQDKAAAAAALESAKDRIAKLEQKLDFSAEESSQSVEALRAKMKWADSEIRKLWGVSNDRNRKAIAAHKAQLGKLEKQLKTAADQAAKAAKTAAEQADTLTSLSAGSEAAKATLAKAEQQLQAQDKTMKTLLADTDNYAEQLDQLRSGLLERVKQNEESIDSITVYRRTTNREILNIQKRLDSLQGVGTAPQ